MSRNRPNSSSVILSTPCEPLLACTLLYAWSIFSRPTTSSIRLLYITYICYFSFDNVQTCPQCSCMVCVGNSHTGVHHRFRLRSPCIRHAMSIACLQLHTSATRNTGYGFEGYGVLSSYLVSQVVYGTTTPADFSLLNSLLPERLHFLRAMRPPRVRCNDFLFMCPPYLLLHVPDCYWALS